MSFAPPRCDEQLSSQLFQGSVSFSFLSWSHTAARTAAPRPVQHVAQQRRLARLPIVPGLLKNKEPRRFTFDDEARTLAHDMYY